MLRWDGRDSGVEAPGWRPCPWLAGRRRRAHVHRGWQWMLMASVAEQSGLGAWSGLLGVDVVDGLEDQGGGAVDGAANRVSGAVAVVDLG
jgi:hypothetical protein